MGEQHVLVTGGTGFLGRWIVKGLKERYPEFKITVADIKKKEPSEDAIMDGIGFVQVDIVQNDQVVQVMEEQRPTIVIHTAGIVPVGNDRYTPPQEVRDRTYDVNVNGTKHVLEAARAAGVKHFVFTSSFTIVTDENDRDHPNMDESAETGRASLIYGLCKGIAEKLVLEADGPGMHTCCIRPSVILGPGEYNLLPTIQRCIAKGETPFVIGSAENLYDFTYVSNVADAHVLAVENLLTTQTAAGQAFFISNGQPVPFRDFCLAVWAEFDHVPKYRVWIPTSVASLAGFLAEWTTRLTGTEPTLSRGSVKDFTQTAYANLRKAREILGYEPKVGLPEGIRLSCQDLRRRLQTGALR